MAFSSFLNSSELLHKLCLRSFHHLGIHLRFPVFGGILRLCQGDPLAGGGENEEHLVFGIGVEHQFQRGIPLASGVNDPHIDTVLVHQFLGPGHFLFCDDIAVNHFLFPP